MFITANVPERVNSDYLARRVGCSNFKVCIEMAPCIGKYFEFTPQENSLPILKI